MSHFIAALTVLLLAAPAVAWAAGRAPRTQRPETAKPFLDVRVQPGVSIQRPTRPLTGPASGDRRTIALRWLNRHRGRLGLSAADVRALRLNERSVDARSGLTRLRFGQSYRGIPAFGAGVAVSLDRAGQILSVTGTPLADLRPTSTKPKLSASEAMAALQANVGVRRASRGGAPARRVLFDGPGGTRLAWHLGYRASPQAYYDAIVDAASGKVLFRQNLTKSDADESVFPDYPGAPGGPVAVNFEERGWLADGTTTLNGPFVHTFSDLDDDPNGSFASNLAADSGEEITRPDGDADFPDAFTPFPAPSGWINACEFEASDPDWPDPIATTAQCSWDPTAAGSWADNRSQNGVQAFYLANAFHDHLAAAPIGFNAASDNFEGTDKVVVNTDDGADTAGGLPDSDHLDNANMTTLPEGMGALMQMYLFAYDTGLPATFNSRNVNGGDSAAIVWHEYTHGLSNRLVTWDDGTGALSSAHGGALGEAWSDWYALDFLVRQGLETDTAAPGDVDVGAYVDAGFASTRWEPIDCRVEDTTTPRCPGGVDGVRGGFTFGDFGHVAGAPEVHSDGEIWAQTLWDLRRVLGSTKAEQLITDGMRITPPEPSFLDARDAILAAEAALGNADRAKIWAVFAHRGMGYRASASGSSDTSPHQDFTVPPPPANVPPIGTLRASPARVNPGQAVQLTAAFTDSDSTITAYGWDFDDNGVIDRTTRTPTTSFAYSRGGDYTARVVVPDSRGASGAAIARIHATVDPALGRLPRSGRKGAAKVRVSCDTTCTATAKLKIAKKLAKRLGLKKARTVGSLKRTLGAGSTRLTIKLTGRARRALKRHHRKSLKATLSVTLSYPDGRRDTAHRSVTIRR